MQDAEEFCIDDEVDEEEKRSRPVVKNAMDLQRLKLEKLMKNPEKPIIIPEPSKEKDFMQTVPTFVRNVMGSSAGAGSGEFHVYRHLRRKEYARQKYIQAKSIREQLDDDYRQKLEQNRLDAEAKTAKRRAKRLKKKQKMKQKGTKRRKGSEGTQHDEDNLSDSSESEISEKAPNENLSLIGNVQQSLQSKDDRLTESGNCGLVNDSPLDIVQDSAVGKEVEDLSQTGNVKQSVQSEDDRQTESGNCGLVNDGSLDIVQDPVVEEKVEDLSLPANKDACSIGSMQGEHVNETTLLKSPQGNETTNEGESKKAEETSDSEDGQQPAKQELIEKTSL